MRVERLPVNVGSGLASARGLELATGDYVARHDSDDVSLPQRLERQMAAVEERGLDLVGAEMLEFEGSPDHVIGRRTAPTSHEAIVRRLRLNNPVNNPTVVFRRELSRSRSGATPTCATCRTTTSSAGSSPAAPGPRTSPSRSSCSTPATR